MVAEVKRGRRIKMTREKNGGRVNSMKGGKGEPHEKRVQGPFDDFDVCWT